LCDERFRPNLARMVEALHDACGTSFCAAVGPALRQSAARLLALRTPLWINSSKATSSRPWCAARPTLVSWWPRTPPASISAAIRLRRGWVPSATRTGSWGYICTIPSSYLRTALLQLSESVSVTSARYPPRVPRGAALGGAVGADVGPIHAGDRQTPDPTGATDLPKGE
jgi:hypothetical protein